MEIVIGLTNSDLTGKRHKVVKVFAAGGLQLQSSQGVSQHSASELEFRASNGKLISKGLNQAQQSVVITPLKPGQVLMVNSLRRPGIEGSPAYLGKLQLAAYGNEILLVLHSDLVSYLQGVLHAEIPASYHLEAIKAQAIAAATYALRPRVDHRGDGFQVCDSYLCCQYFSGTKSGITARHKQAIESTAGQIVTYDNQPILALFSSCAGGHTESYENCFSDLLSNQFPSAAIPYLTGVSEGRLPAGYPQIAALKQLWQAKTVDTVDSWSPHFRWQVKLSDSALEGQMHHVIEQLRLDAQFAPFILPPKNERFGHIDSFEITRRGVAGTAMEMTIHTSTGNWILRKELTIRSAFQNSEAKVGRLKSGRLYFEHKRNPLGLLSELTICGLGWGHGVGLQQTGSQGWALKGKTYREILAHYYPGTVIQQV